MTKRKNRWKNIMEAIKSIRNVRTKNECCSVEKSKKCLSLPTNPKFSKGCEVFFEKLASSLETVVAENEDGIPENAVTTVVDNAKNIYSVRRFG
ncbi:MAG: hypothetical protein L6V93_06680 [Clostridiales bacterium]|nr:MAG: hypothetical protein L6V93_06680 [Clostridiales bacterium]